MKMDEAAFLGVLKQKAKAQAKIDSSSPIPSFLKPFFSVMGLHFWQFLLGLSFVISIPVSILGFSLIYSRALGF
ncbi:hypothetical protein KBD71_02705 [Candidatus Woesebacteria bacterium]|nr:hypothetical protein [Candidatus Woesebacteria bacterium]